MLCVVCCVLWCDPRWVANTESMFSGTKQLVYEKVPSLDWRVGVGLGCVEGTVLFLGRVGVVLGWSGY